ncbi:MAG: Rrf2 family transcriptional regulator [Tepidiforma sp.]|jgi:Rrf2 family protein|uniref:Rrf2 family transcriptional regulator n=1 Tax=Tepidiforma bonchosmolovskayae TaxID=2601677 RepID=A0ABX6C4T6_9CHLR|nr:MULTISPECIES: Rrf2 family transcriptional regulator [Tepidiforma]QFG03250.1 Rrf2 family transcriptional regulator [Tepidiforma bonchosmolovskayae]GIW14900.1 MAG: Rrf2 family transcriptional regulator [Tepidiforma sp.]
MRVSTRGDYGLRALIELAANYGGGPLQSSEIALRRHIPEQYLDQLLATLRKAGFIRSVRGPSGGHELVRPPDQITVKEVIEALEGSLSPVAWLDEPPEMTDHPHQCGQREIWERIRKATEEILASYTVADLLEREPTAVAGRWVI